METTLPQITAVHMQDEEIIQATARQVIKDFQMYDLHLSFERKGETPYQVLFDQILPRIRQMMQNDAGTLHALLYTIDIPDHWWAHVRHEPDLNTVASAITDLILRRELLKVLTRMAFSQKKLENSDET